MLEKLVLLWKENFYNSGIKLKEVLSCTRNTLGFGFRLGMYNDNIMFL